MINHIKKARGDLEDLGNDDENEVVEEELLTAENVKFGAVMKPPSAVAFPSAREMRSTLYFWWLVYLRSSLDYWWICQEKGKCNDPRLVKVWKDFGKRLKNK